MYLRGIRGASTVDRNVSEDILSETTALLSEMMIQNNVDIDDVASIFFSLTSDLNAVFPAKAARDLGFLDTSLLCMTEIDVPGSVKKCLRILIHVNTDKRQSDIKHIYLKGAVALRPDHNGDLGD